MANKNVFSKSYFTYFLTCHRGPCRVYILKFWRVRFDISRFYDHFCHPGCPPHISGTAAAVVTKLAQVQCSDICLPYCYHMQPQRPLASSEGRSKPGYPLADYAEFEKIHTNIAKHLPTVFSFSYASKGLSIYKMRYFAKLKSAPCTPRGQLKFSIAVRAERVCTHIAARTPSVYT